MWWSKYSAPVGGVRKQEGEKGERCSTCCLYARNAAHGGWMHQRVPKKNIEEHIEL